MQVEAEGLSSWSIVLPGLHVGGAERVTIDMANALADRGHDVELVLLTREESLIGLVSAEVTVVRLGSRRTIAAAPALARHLRRRCPDVVVGVLSHVALLLLALRVLRLIDRPVIAYEHQRRSQVASLQRGRGRLVNPLLRWLYPRADRILTMAPPARQELIGLGCPPDRVHVVNNGLDFARIRELANEPIDEPTCWHGRSLRLLFVGRLAAQKDPERAVDLVATLPDAGLVILGDGELAQPIADRVRQRGLADRVDLLGVRFNPYPYMKAADGLVSTSRVEVLPTIFLEAISLGTPVVADSGPGVEYDDLVAQVGEYLTLVPERTLAALTAEVETLGRSSERTPADLDAYDAASIAELLADHANEALARHAAGARSETKTMVDHSQL